MRHKLGKAVGLSGPTGAMAAWPTRPGGHGEHDGAQTP